MTPLSAKTLAEYAPTVLRIDCARCQRQTHPLTITLRAKYGSDTLLGEVARRVAAAGGCALAQDADHSLCSVRPIEPPVEFWATLNDARLGQWGAVLYCRRTLEALKRRRSCQPPTELDVLSLVAVLGHDQPLDRLPSKMRCPGCESSQVEVRWFVRAEPDPGGTTAAVVGPVKLRPLRLSEAQKKFRVIEGSPKKPNLSAKGRRA